MKKLSILFGFFIVGSACATPPVSLGKAECDAQENHVFVYKDDFCAPINPCVSDDESIKNKYCLTDIKLLPHNQKPRDLLINRYVENFLHTKVVEISDIPGMIEGGGNLFFDGEKFDAPDAPCVGVHTADGGYFATPYNPDETAEYKDDDAIDMAFEFNGYDDTHYDWREGEDVKITEFYIDNYIPDMATCESIRDFANALKEGAVKSWGYQDGKCALVYATREESGW